MSIIRKLIKAHNRFYQKWEERRQYQDQTCYGAQQRKDIIVDLILSVRPSLVVDIGCAEGAYGIEIVRVSYLDYVGVDVIRSNLVKMIQWSDSLSLKDRIGAVVCEASTLAFRSASADVVLCSEVLEHVMKPQNVANEAARITKKFIIVSTPCVSRLEFRRGARAVKALWNTLNSLERYSGNKEIGKDIVKYLGNLHVHLFSLSFLRNVLIYSGLEIITITGVDFTFPLKHFLISYTRWRKFFSFIETRFLADSLFFKTSVGTSAVGFRFVIILCGRYGLT